ncbi:hypothetical protein ACFFGH_05580 [Lysobacter korlensis]|uniref:Uncharacterized protein n=1 Tax=Lysobacter korlensis TaxID=553636 RepID=A0ABV6RLQ5_9GAMM
MTPLISAITLTVLGAGLIGLFAYLMHRAASQEAAEVAPRPDVSGGVVLACVGADAGDAGSGD